MNRHLIVAALLCLSSPLLLAEQKGHDNQQNTVLTNNTEENKKAFVLNLWAPDEVAPPEANLAEFGDSYQYLYTPEELYFDEDETNRTVVFRFHPDTNNRYQFRWITTDHPEHMTLTKKRDRKVKIAVDDGAVAEEMYFEVWVYDTKTGQRFMCDPRLGVGGTRG